ncbi:hypothetical protein [Okeania sp. SIO2B3]|uniref:hypothetical protein n=1 Tax=Okeania sp. SIO2B3 TaxID=2607784 RepID=UPI0013C02C65|nr:hypothetical protein [Okeania sp. SIO2B3]NET43509.1 hypothetical protein [Okeania sp. SIO2B3]
MCEAATLIGIPIRRSLVGERGYKCQHLDKLQITHPPTQGFRLSSSDKFSYYHSIFLANLAQYF